MEQNSSRSEALQVIKNWIILCVSLAIAWFLCSLFKDYATTDVYVPLIFVLAVLIISLLTDGYVYGILASLVSVIGVNWAFTYPYMKINFSIYGYPMTFTIMLAVSIIVSTLVSRLQEHEKLKRETEQEKLRANLLRAVSHDLRTPLTSIIGSLDTVIGSDDRLSAQQRDELLFDAKTDAEWLVRMVENLLSITRINGDTEISKSPEALEELVGECAAAFRKRNPDIELKVTVPDDLVLVDVDAMLIEQVLMNLLDNSVHHGVTTTKIGITVSVEGELVYVRVRDNGKGIDSSVQPKLFDGMLSDTDSNRYRGIGLAVCKTIISAHGGSIFGENLPEGGAMFGFTLPKEDTL